MVIGVVTAIGGFVDIGELVAMPQAGAEYRFGLLWAGLVGAGGDSNLMPTILDAVRAEATLGEICGSLRTVFGAYRPASAAQI